MLIIYLAYVTSTIPQHLNIPFSYVTFLGLIAPLHVISFHYQVLLHYSLLDVISFIITKICFCFCFYSCHVLCKRIGASCVLCQMPCKFATSFEMCCKPLLEFSIIPRYHIFMPLGISAKCPTMSSLHVSFKTPIHVLVAHVCVLCFLFAYIFIALYSNVSQPY